MFTIKKLISIVSININSYSSGVHLRHPTLICPGAHITCRENIITIDLSKYVFLRTYVRISTYLRTYFYVLMYVFLRTNLHL